MEKKKIKIWLQYPRKFPDSPYYKYLVESPPQEVKYLNAEIQKGVVIDKRKGFMSNSLKQQIRDIIGFFRLPIPNLHFTRTKKNYDLIHCAHCISGNKFPWVADFESSWQIFASGRTTFLGQKIIEKLLKNKYCKKIIAWTESTKKEFLKIFPNLEGKIGVIYPAVPMQKNRRKKGKNILLLFVGRYFYAKGGHHVLKIMDDLTQKYSNVKGIMVSEIPEDIKKKYSRNKKIEFASLMPQKDLFDKIYSKADIFLYPGYSDTFGFSILEAMSFGIPVITADGFARKELIENGKTGFVAEAEEKRDWERDYLKIKEEGKIIKSMTASTEKLIINKRLRKKMSKNCIEIIKNGKFSIKERNKKLRKVYEEALKQEITK